MSLTDLLEELEAAKDPKKAGPMEAYMRHQFSFLGVAAPERNKLYKKYFPEAKKTKIIDWDFVDTCWEKESREYLYAAANPEHIYKLGLIFPAYVLFDDVKETYQNLGSPSFDQLPDSLTHHNASLGKIYLTDALDIDIEDVQKRIIAPTLIVHGTNDTIAPYQYSVDAIQRIPNAKLVTVEGGRHRIDENFSKIAIPAIQNFLAE